MALPFFGIGMKTDLFQSCGHCWVFQICWHIECSTVTASPFVSISICIFYIYSSHLSPKFQIRVFKYISSLMPQGNLKFEQYNKNWTFYVTRLDSALIFLLFQQMATHLSSCTRQRPVSPKNVIHPLLDSVYITSWLFLKFVYVSPVYNFH